MTQYLAQRGTKVALVEAESPRRAGELAGQALRLPAVRPRSWARDDLDWTRSTRHLRRQERWLFDWRGRRASLRRATRAEADAFAQAVDQQAEVRAMTRTALREGHEQGVLA